jgi:hypothetical protein
MQVRTFTKNRKRVMTYCKALIKSQWYVVLIVYNLALFTNIIMTIATIHFINTVN